MKHTHSGLSLDVDAEGFPQPSALPEGMLDDVVASTENDVPVHDDGQLAAEFGTPITQIGGDVGVVIHALEQISDQAKVDQPPATPPVFPWAGIFSESPLNVRPMPPQSGQPVIDPSVPAPDPIDVGVEPFEDVDLSSSVGAPPLIRPSKDERDFSSTPLWMREAKPNNAQCWTCKHGSVLFHVQPVRSHSYTPLRIVMLCEGWGKRNPRDVTETTVLYCTKYKKDKLKAAERRTPQQIADDLRRELGATSPIKR